ncbi:MAG: AIM24 family protein, partial [Chloroflexota bacterium]
LAAGQSIIAQKDSFMVAEDDVTLEMHFRRKLSTGFFGGEGFILQKLTGPGTAFVEIAGEFYRQNRTR